MPKLEVTTKTVHTPRRREVCRVKVEGILSAATVPTFRQVMNENLSRNRDLLVDLGEVTYINSSGLGEFVRVHDEQQQKSLNIVLVNLDPDMARLVDMLGLTNVLCICDSTGEGLARLDEGVAARPSFDLDGEGPDHRGQAFVPLREAVPPKLPQARILLAMRKEDAFSRFLARCLSGHDGNVVLVQNDAQAEEALREGKVHLAILESTLGDAQAISARLKTETPNGLSSVIMIYPSEQDLAMNLSYRVCEDEYVVEPFEVRELVALCQSEYERCESEAILFLQEIHIEIASRDQAVARANQVMEKILADSGLAMDKSDSFFYAVREAIDNARRHGNRQEPDKVIDILYVLDKEKVTATVGDEGEGFDFSTVMDHARHSSPIEQARQRHSQGEYGGLGIGLMLRCCDKVEYLPPGNMVKLTKYR